MSAINFENIKLTDKESMILLNLIFITEDMVHKKRLEDSSESFGEDALFAYRKLSCQILENYMKKKRYLTLNIYELDYLLSAVEIGKDINEDREKEIFSRDILISLFKKMYRKHRKHKKTIIDFYSSNDEIERLKILKEISEEKNENT